MLPYRFWPALTIIIMLYLPIEAQANQQDTASTGPMLTTVVTVVNESGEPVEGASIEVDGLRPVVRPGAMHVLWTSDLGPAPVAQTDSDGKALVRYSKFLSKDIVLEDMLTGAISFSVTHPKFVPYRNTNYPVNGPNNPIRLQQGAIFKVRGFVEENGTKRILKNVFPLVEAATGYSSRGDWMPKEEGWLETTSFAPGETWFMLAHLPKCGRVLFSFPDSVWLQHRAAIKNELRVFPGTFLEGELDNSVPRPIRNGLAIACCSTRNPRVPKSLTWRDWTSISEDGTFIFESLPMDRVELIAICDGYRSKIPDDAKTRLTPQSFSLGGDTTKIVLKMERTATAEIHLTNPEGKPVQRAKVSFYPNVRWNGRFSTIFGSKSRTRDAILEMKASGHEDELYTSESDENGVAVVKNLPGGKNSYLIKHEKYTIPAKIVYENVRGQFESIELESGERAVANVVLIEKGTDTLSGGVNQEVK